MTLKLKTAALVAVIGIALSPALMFAQTSKGMLSGVVRDSTGAVVPGAKIVVKSEDTGETRTVQADNQGAYRVDAINPGSYSVHVEQSGFSVENVKGIRVAPSRVTSYDVRLAVGAVTTDVTVQAASNTINTDNGTISGTVASAELAQVPIFSLNPIELVATLPGVVLTDPNIGLGGQAGNYEQIQANGARGRANSFLLDSQDINDVGIGGQAFDPQIPDMYQSETVILNSASAEYGRAGGVIVNLVTKSGTNQFHGSAFELYTGSGLDAIDGLTRQGKPYTYNPKARYDEHQYGFTAGGPIWKDKLFAFGGGMWSRYYGKSDYPTVLLPTAAGYAQLSSISASVPSLAPRVALLQSMLGNGAYLQSYRTIQPSTKTLSVSPADCGNSSGCQIQLAFLQRLPVTQQAPDTQWMYRIDYIPHEADVFTFRYLHDRESYNPYGAALNPTTLPGFDAEVSGPTELGIGTWTHVFTPRLLNEFRLSEVRLSSLFVPTSDTLANPASALPNITIAGSGIPTLGISQNMPQGRVQELYQFQDTLSWTIGRQSLRIGADLSRDLEKDLVAQNALGAYSFVAGGNVSSNSALDNFLNNTLGPAGSITRAFGPTRVDPHLWKLSGFVQDDIKLLPTLTFNVGMRYDYMTPPENSTAYPSINTQNILAPINTYTPVNADKNNIAPRIGFSWNPHEGFLSDGKTVVRGGFGIFYDVDFTNILINSVQSAPISTSGLVQGIPSNNYGQNATSLFSTITPVLTPQSSVLSVSNNLVSPLIYQYNLGIERQLPFNLTLVTSYVGSNGKKLFASTQLNPYYNGARINPSRGAITVRNNGADSNYNSGQLELSRSFSHGLMFRVSYAYGKMLDDASEIFANNSNFNTAYGANLTNIHQEYSASSWDRRHVASFEYVWSPVGFHSDNKGLNLFYEAFTRHFTVSGTTQFTSGPPSSIQIDGIDTNNDVNPYNDRPLIGNIHAPQNTVGVDGVYLGAPASPGVYYDLAANNATGAFTPVSPGAVKYLIPYGPQYTTQEIGRNSFYNPGAQVWNFAAEKAIPAALPHLQDGQFVFRVEVQNIGNHNNVGILDTNLLDVGTTNYMNYTNAREATNQHVRLWAKYRF